MATEVARSVVYVSLFVEHAGEPAESAEPIEMPFEMLPYVGPRNRVLDRVHIVRLAPPGE